jgi:exodeoxyribonuclease V alpha subunit
VIKFERKTFQNLNPDFFSEIDICLADFIQRISEKEDPLLFLTLAFLSRETAAGHICLDLSEYAGKRLIDKDKNLVFPDFTEWQKDLLAVSTIGSPGDFKPVILDESGRLYLFRYWQYETDLAKTLIKRAKTEHDFQDSSFVRKMIKKYFPDTEDKKPDMQRAAAFNALIKNLCIICGGPGTGKTTTVAKILALMLECSPKELKIALAAPTGKAADRLQKAIASSKTELPCSEKIISSVPETASTLHRLLGTIPNTSSFRHNKDNLLPYDIVVIDEASMIDLPLLSKILSAASAETSIILIGDKDQLASVESGAALGDICTKDAVNFFSSDLCKVFRNSAGIEIISSSEKPSPPVLSDCIVELDKNYRFGSNSHIFKLSSAINRGDISGTLAALEEAGDSVSHIKTSFQAHIKNHLSNIITENFLPFIKAPSCEIALPLLDRFRILCALRKGPFGTRGINSVIEKKLVEMNHIDPAARFYHGRPVMITQNDYSLKLFNGDTGIIFNDPDKKGETKAYFKENDNTIRAFHPSVLPEHETVYAMTIHKSQGSEFDNVMLVLPENESPVLTRELLYTAVTRTKEKIQIIGSEKIISYAVSRNIERRSGLKDMLKGE